MSVCLPAGIGVSDGRDWLDESARSKDAKRLRYEGREKEEK